jgi:hypothetical protein
LGERGREQERASVREQERASVREQERASVREQERACVREKSEREQDQEFSRKLVAVYYSSTVPFTTLFACGEGDSGGHVWKFGQLGIEPFATKKLAPGSSRRRARMM